MEEVMCELDLDRWRKVPARRRRALGSCQPGTLTSMPITITLSLMTVATKILAILLRLE